MNIKYLLLIICSLTLSVSCSDKDDPIIDDEGSMEKPTASFTYKIEDQKDPFTFEFTNSSTNYTETRWSFDDDSTSSEFSPVHTYLKTGTFNVKMIALNEQGYWAQREELLTILPEDLVELVASPSGEELQVGYATPMDVKSTQWLLKEDETTYKLISTENNMLLDVPEDEFKSAIMTITTPKGSQISRTMLLSPKGIVEDLTKVDNVFSISHENSSGSDAGEGSSKLIDNNINSKLYVANVNDDYFYWQFNYATPQIVNGYMMTSGNDSDSRDPKTWEVLGSQDGQQWKIIDSRTDEEFTERKQSRYFSYQNNTSYNYYRIHIISRKSSSSFQMSEFRMLKLPE